MTFDMQKWLSDQAITEVECLVSDISGIPRGKILPVSKFVSAQDTGGLRLPEYVFGQSVTGEYYDSDVLNEIGENPNLKLISTRMPATVGPNKFDISKIITKPAFAVTKSRLLTRLLSIVSPSV